MPMGLGFVFSDSVWDGVAIHTGKSHKKMSRSRSTKKRIFQA